MRGLDGAFIQHRGTLYTLGCTRDLKTEENVIVVLLWLPNVMPSPAAAVACFVRPVRCHTGTIGDQIKERKNVVETASKVSFETCRLLCTAQGAEP